MAGDPRRVRFCREAGGMSTAGEISGTAARSMHLSRGYTRHIEDWYIEPSWTVDLLLDQEPFVGGVWDPACGCGTIPKTCSSRAIHATGSDIVDRGFGCRYNFLSEFEPPLSGYANIVSNPPYRIAAEFIDRALTLASSKVAMLVQSKFPYSQRRHALFSERPPARLYFLSTRPSMPPGEELLAGTIKAEGGKLDYLWMVWDREHSSGTTECRWLKRGSS
jgi:hypothetical protein